MILTENWHPLRGETTCGEFQSHSVALPMDLAEIAKVGKARLLLGQQGWLAVEITTEKTTTMLDPVERALKAFGAHLSSREKLRIKG